jgi:hypothetical protein
MKCLTVAIALSCAVSVVTPLEARQLPAAKGDLKLRRVVLTESDYGKTIRVKKGDLVEVRLLAGGLKYWVLEKPNPFLRSMFDLPEFKPAPRIGDTVTLDGRIICVNLFEVVGECDDLIPLELMYCHPQTVSDVRAKLKPKEPNDLAFWTRKRIERKQITRQKFRPDPSASKLKEGMVFQAELRTTDEQPASKQPKTAK